MKATSRTEKNSSPSAIQIICRMRACRCRLSQTSASQARTGWAGAGGATRVLCGLSIIGGASRGSGVLSAEQVAQHRMGRIVQRFQQANREPFLEHQPAQVLEEPLRVA